MVFFVIFGAVFTRIMFLVHGAVSVALVVDSQNDPIYWWLCTGLFFLLIESFYTIVIRKGKEYKYFWPGSLLYMLTVLPAIWVAELAILNQKLAGDPTECIREANENTFETPGGLVIIKTDSHQLAQKWSKLGLILLLIVGRWLLPRGEITRDQLSNLLLVYVANAADIMELFEVFDNQPELWCHQGVATAVLVTYTWCFIQFTLVFTATAQTVPDNQEEKKGKIDLFPENRGDGAQETTKLPRYIKKLIKQKHKDKLAEIEKTKNLQSAVDHMKQLKAYNARGRQARYSIHDTALELVAVQREVKREEEILEEHIKEKQKLQMHGDLYSILTLMFMQDGPFLIVRIVLISAFGVYDQLHLFFTGKNAIALMLLLYRLYVLIVESKEDHETNSRMDDTILENEIWDKKITTSTV